MDKIQETGILYVKWTDVRCLKEGTKAPKNRDSPDFVTIDKS